MTRIADLADIAVAERLGKVNIAGRELRTESEVGILDHADMFVVYITDERAHTMVEETFVDEREACARFLEQARLMNGSGAASLLADGQSLTG